MSEFACRSVAALVLVALAGSVNAQQTNRPQFEAASVKPASPDCSTEIGRRFAASASQSSAADSPRVRLFCATLSDLIRIAYDLAPGMKIVRGPAWLFDAEFEIDATAGTTAGNAQKRLMLQVLLEDRFQLKLHREDPIRPVFALVVAKGGPKPKLHSVEPGTALHGQIMFRMSGKTLSWTGVKAPIGELVAWLRSSVPERPVIDATGLAGAYDFKLEWVEDEDQPVVALSSALDQELGLKLEPRTAPVEAWIVDRAEKPSANE